MDQQPPKQPPTLEEYRKRLEAERREIRRQICEQYLLGNVAAAPKPIPKSSVPARPEHFLPGLDPHQRKGGRR